MYNLPAMKKDIHPQHNLTTFVCNSCKTTFQSESTVDGTINVEVCSQCHPFFTGEAGNLVGADDRVKDFLKFEEAKDDKKVALKRVKKASRAAAKNKKAIDAGSQLTLRDMLKQK